jgi:hypothetical protein
MPSLTGDQTFDKPDHPRREGTSLFPVAAPDGLSEQPMLGPVRCGRRDRPAG